MTDKVIHVNVTSTKSQRVSVSPGNVQNEITATPDSSQYYSNLAKNWAIGAGLILNEDYSSKHYAKESANSASSAKNYADATQATYQNVQNVANEALTDIETARVDAVDNITTVKSESIASVEAKGNEANALVNTGIANINTAKTEAVNAVTTTKNNAVTEINKEVTDGKKELNDIIEAGGLNINDKITNCLLEVPQNIKLELNNGTLTLKAGSKVIVPNGAGVFDEVVITQDKSTNPTANGVWMCFVNESGNLQRWIMKDCFSGTTAPTSATYPMWYDTTNNIIKSSDNKGSTWAGKFSLPIAIFTISNGVITSIDQVFNGMGYIGSTVWVDKGVKALIPDGFNNNGTLKNIEVTTSKVSTRTIESNVSGNIVCVLDRSDYISRAVVSNYYYDADLNKTFWFGNASACVKFVDFTATNGVISNFQPKLPVRLLTYDDIKINNPYFFGQYIWSEFAPSNLSWLKSSGQWNSGSGYQSFYDWALANANANKAGFKLSTASYTDYDFVVNTSAKTFRLPIKVKGKMGEAVIGNGMTLGLTDGTNNLGAWLNTTTSGQALIPNRSFYGLAVGSGNDNTLVNNGVSKRSLGVTTDSTKSGLELDSTGLSLYFYVGETVKDPTLINMAQIASNFADKIGRTECKAYITETYSNGASWYKVYSPDSTGQKWCEQGGVITINTTSNTGTRITFLKPFINSNYQRIVGAVEFSNNTTNYVPIVSIASNSSIDNNGFSVVRWYVQGGGTGIQTSGNIQWQACGYIA